MVWDLVPRKVGKAMQRPKGFKERTSLLSGKS